MLNRILIDIIWIINSFIVKIICSNRFVQFTGKDGGPKHLGVQLVQGGDIIAVSAIDSRIPNTMKKFLEGGDDLLKKAKR